MYHYQDTEGANLKAELDMWSGRYGTIENDQGSESKTSGSYSETRAQSSDEYDTMGGQIPKTISTHNEELSPTIDGKDNTTDNRQTTDCKSDRKSKYFILKSI